MLKILVHLVHLVTKLNSTSASGNVQVTFGFSLLYPAYRN